MSVLRTTRLFSKSKVGHRDRYKSAPRKNTKYNGIFNDIFQSKSNVSTYQSSIDLARAESHNRLSKTARRDVCCKVVMQCINCISFWFLDPSKKRKTHSLKILSESNSRGTRIRFKKLNGWNLSQSRSFRTDVVVDFFYNEEIQRRQRKEREKKWEETRPRESKLPGVLEPPLSVLSQKRLFVHLPLYFS
jgi:hypothetical protein